MAGEADAVVALLPIKPHFAKRIMEGTKRVEFRRRPFARAPEWVVVYASAPEKRVLGCFSVRGVDECSPESLWQRYERVGGIARADFAAYYTGRDRGVALLIDEVHALDDPLELREIGDGLLPPQSYRYLEPGVSTALVGDARRVHAV